LRYQRFINELARILDHLANYPETTLMFVPFCGERDNQVHRDVVAKMKHADRTKILQAASPQETQRMIAEADFIFGMRLHSLIMAAAAYRPFFAIDYLTKVSDFLESLLPGTAHAVSVSPVDLSADVVIGKLENLRVTDYFGANYVSAVARLKSRERENVKLLHTTFGSSCFSAGAID
jgi:polysaccharide pyruvyl transferase WcaK-like protein